MLQYQFNMSCIIFMTFTSLPSLFNLIANSFYLAFGDDLEYYKFNTLNNKVCNILNEVLYTNFYYMFLVFCFKNNYVIIAFYFVNFLFIILYNLLFKSYTKLYKVCNGVSYGINCVYLIYLISNNFDIF